MIFGLSYGLILALFGSALCLFTCTTPPDYNDIPEIEFVGTSKTRLNQQGLNALYGKDSLLIFINFTDGDGDLDETGVVQLIDQRDTNLVTEYQLPKIEQQGAANGISGEMSIVIFAPCCIIPPNGQIPQNGCDYTNPFLQALDSVAYRLRLRDHAGHWSNTVLTTPIELKCK